MSQAPEIINEKGYDDKTDIWSLGCLIYELAALKPAFDATNAIALAQKINQGKFPRIPSKFSESLYNLILTMVQTDPKRRPRVDDLLELPVLQVKMMSITSHCYAYTVHALSISIESFE